MRKVLLKLILTLFIFSVIDPAAYSSSELTRDYNADQYQTYVKSRAHALSLVKIAHEANAVTFHTYGSEKPAWTGDAATSGLRFTLACRTLFLQNSPHAAYRLQFLQLQLFPFHFFW